MSASVSPIQSATAKTTVTTPAPQAGSFLGRIWKCIAGHSEESVWARLTRGLAIGLAATAAARGLAPRSTLWSGSSCGTGLLVGGALATTTGNLAALGLPLMSCMPAAGAEESEHMPVYERPSALDDVSEQRAMAVLSGVLSGATHIGELFIHPWDNCAYPLLQFAGDALVLSAANSTEFINHYPQTASLAFNRMRERLHHLEALGHEFATTLFLPGKVLKAAGELLKILKVPGIYAPTAGLEGEAMGTFMHMGEVTSGISQDHDEEQDEVPTPIEHLREAFHALESARQEGNSDRAARAEERLLHMMMHLRGISPEEAMKQLRPTTPNMTQGLERQREVDPKLNYQQVTDLATRVGVMPWDPPTAIWEYYHRIGIQKLNR